MKGEGEGVKGEAFQWAGHIAKDRSIQNIGDICGECLVSSSSSATPNEERIKVATMWWKLEIMPNVW